MTEPTTIPARKRVLSGMRPTGRLHLGNYMGALKNWVALQHQYDCYFFIADYHALTTDYADTSKLKENVYEVALDFLAAGLDPELCTIFIQSHVPQHAELNLLLGMITSVGSLERVPTYKDQQEQLKDKDLSTYGFLGYPLMMSADILVYQADFVPVGQDQAAHVEITREIARKFNFLYTSGGRASVSSAVEAPSRSMSPSGGPVAVTSYTPENLHEFGRAEAILPEPQVLLTPSPKLLGTDGRKMSKSYGNTILLTDSPSVVFEKVAGMYNGGQRIYLDDPGDPEICPVGDLHRLFSPKAIDSEIRAKCKAGTITCMTCKKLAADSVNTYLNPIRERRERLQADPAKVWSALEKGARSAATRAEKTMEKVRAVMGLSRTLPAIGRTARQAYSTREASRFGHDLSAYQAWWEGPPDDPVRAKNLRDYWLANIVPTEVKLAQDSDRVFVTWKKKRIYVTTSREGVFRPEQWGFKAKPKSYEVLALLCWDKHFRLLDFIVPQIVYQAPWTAYKKTHKNEDLVFWVKRSEGHYYLYLELPSAVPMDITQYLGDYEPMS